MGFFGMLLLVGMSILIFKKTNFSLIISIGLSIAISIALSILMGVFILIGFLPMLVLIVVGIGTVYFLYKKQETDWKKKEFSQLSAVEIAREITEFATQGDMVLENIPINRAEYFNMDSKLKYSDDVYPIIYNAQPAKNEMTFVEYGYLITTNELVYKWQVRNKESKNKNDKYTFEKHSISMSGLYKQYSLFNHLILFYIDNHKPIIIKNPPVIFEKVIDYVIASGWSKQAESILQDKAIDIEKTVELEQQIEKVEKSFLELKKQTQQKEWNKNFINAQTLSYVKGNIGEINANAINSRFSKQSKNPNVSAKGHGFVGEQAGNVYDRLFLKNAIPLGTKRDPKTQRIIKNGADRQVNNMLIQTKFCKTAGKSIGQAFYNDGPKYINHKTGKMMQIEVPKEQYSQAVKIVEKKIRQGLVPGETKATASKNAHKYVKKSPMTYEQAQIATTSIFDRRSQSLIETGSNVKKEVTFRQKLMYSAGLDFFTGATIALPSSIISGVWVYCSCKWNGLEEEDARKQALMGTIKPIVFSGFTYMIASQFAGSHIGKNIGEKAIASKFLKNINTDGQATKMITGSTLTLISVGVTVGPDVYNFLRGRISSKQIIKNTLTSGIGGVSGLAVGAALGSFVPVVGTFVGGMAGSAMGTMISKKVFDGFIEDDAVAMLRIAKEEFIQNVIFAGLTQEEFNKIMEDTFLKKDFDKVLKIMYASGDAREFIKKTYMDLISQAYSARPLPDAEEVGDYLREMYTAQAEIT
ncbi:hypothetical protein [Staphylococcus simulans]|uniref:hypothetical protein n=1 Tax=Staphylococcus simulans TaxID=1286 RepID=UPI003F800B77